MSKKINYNNK